MTAISKKLLLSPWTALLTLMLVLAVRIVDPAFVESVRLRYFDTLITSKEPVVNNVYTVNIDEAALDRWGQWPFPRDVYAEIVSELYAHNAGLVVWNVLMPEKDRFGGDAALAAAMAKHPVVLSNVPSDKTKNIPKYPGTAVIGADHADMIIAYPGIIANVPSLESKAAGVGLVSTIPEVDGVNRRLPLIISVNGTLYPSLAMETLRVAAGDSTTQIKLNELGVEKMRIPAFGAIATDSLGRIWIDWSQQSNSASVTDLPKDFGGAVVIVGLTAAGLSNPVPTANGAVWPHEVQASVLGTMFNGVNIERPWWADAAEIITIAVMGLTIILLSRWVYAGIAFFVLLAVGFIFSTHLAYSNWLYLVDATVPTLAIMLVALHAYSVKFISEFLQKQQIKKQFSTYLSPDLVAKLVRNPDLLKLGGDEQELSIMFTDVRGFTSISEHYGKDVQGLTQIMNRYMTAMTRKILENQGTLDKYIGDAQMAFWNAPVPDINHAKLAVKAALEMMESLDEFNKEIAKEGVPAFGMGLGINTGTVVVGNMGSEQRFDYTCLGDSVNLASRLEGQSKPYGVKIILGPVTAERVQDEYPVVELDNIAVKGKTEGVKIYTLGTTVADMHNEYLKEYYRGNWSKATDWAKQLLNERDVTIKGYYEKMIERLAEGAPADWDGTYRATSK